MKNTYAQVLSGFAWLLMIAGTIAGIIMIVHSVGGYGEQSHPFVVQGIILIFASIFGGVLYLTIAKISSDVTESIAGNKKMALFPIWYQKWGRKVADALLESRILKGMTKDQVIESLGNPLSSEQKEAIEVFHYQNPECTKIQNFLFENGVLIGGTWSPKAVKLGFGLKPGMTQKDVDKEIGVPDRVEEKKLKVDDTKQKFIIQYYDSVLRFKESKTTSLKLYFDKDSGLLVREETET
jgi:outer membrane protein assembly factor BamE (lipoprotein component of BamABCDE complex)